MPLGSLIFCRSLIKNPAGVELPLWRLSCNFTRTDGGRDLAMEDKGAPCEVGVSSSPMRGRTATRVQVTADIEFAMYWGRSCLL